jgi:hypothetical protein
MGGGSFSSRCVVTDIYSDNGKYQINLRKLEEEKLQRALDQMREREELRLKEAKRQSLYFVIYAGFSVLLVLIGIGLLIIKYL